MSYLLDTCVISEFVAAQPAEKVVRWLADLDPETVYDFAPSGARLFNPWA